jgi:hypothetical protein
MKAILNRTGALSFAVALFVLVLVMPQFLQAQTVESVPYNPTSTLTPHPTYSVCSDGASPANYTPPTYTPAGPPPPTGAVASCAAGKTLQEVTISVQAELLNPTSGHSYTYQWSFGDSSPLSAVTNVTNAYDLSLQHAYPVATGTNAVGTNYTATVTVTDKTSSTVVGTAAFLVQQQGNTLQVRVNLAIDDGLWYMHQTMWRGTSGPTLGSGGTIPVGGWDSSSGYQACPSVNGGDYDGCQGYAAQTSANVQAFEVSGRLPNGPSTDPYTDDVNRGLNRIFQFLTPEPAAGNNYYYNPANANFGCSDGTAPTTTLTGTAPTATSAPARGYCDASAVEVFYNPSAASCTTGTTLSPCPFTFDANGNKQMILTYGDSQSETNYQSGQLIDAIVASGTPGATALTGVAASGGLPGVVGQTYINIVQDMVEGYEYSQGGYAPQYDVEGGYARGSYECAGGAWLYYPLYDGACGGADNSVSQWAAIGMIGASHGAGYSTTIPAIVTDANNFWITYSEDVQYPKPTGADPISSSDNYGAFGYRGSDYYSIAWGVFADTPSGLVQMSLDGVGRTTNTVFGDATTAPDQRFNYTETMYADNFCNDPSYPYGPDGETYADATYAPRAYAYGMFSFTKSMLLHNPNGVLSPIVYLRTLTPGVFPNSNPAPGQPANSIDWYNALSSENGGTDACNGVAETIVGRQGHDDYGEGANTGGLTNQSNPGQGFWYGNTYDTTQFPFETAWSIIMLRQSVFVACISNLDGKAIQGRGPVAPTITLTWSVQANAASYAIYRSATAGGAATQVGTSTITTFVDKTAGLVNGNTYYYTVQPLNGSGQSICSSNQAPVTIP